jgi:metal-sulfur cluster biosynthetic enzyme/nitrite reductase/ring-hydroxylating ferredoxin subunit
MQFHESTMFHRVADLGEIADPGKILVDVDGETIALFHVGGQFYAIDDVCTHDGGPLVDGELTEHKIACPRHGAKFDIRTGAALSMPAVRATRSHEVKVEDGGVWVRLRSESAPGSPAAHGVDNNAIVSSTPTASPSAGNAAAPSGTAPQSNADGAATLPLSEDGIREMLKQVKDPELFVNIVDLGLIYGVTIAPSAEVTGRQQVSIDMTMTSPACPAGPQLIGDTKRVIGSHADVASVEVRIVMDPPWTPDRMTEAARDQLGIF